jgi:mannosyltransferase OCH1-like enzyme
MKRYSLKKVINNIKILYRFNKNSFIKNIKPMRNSVLQNNQFPNKRLNEYNIQVPPNIFQTWETKNLPPLMFNTVKKIRQINPRFNYYLFDDNDCREFIKNNFDNDVLNAYDLLVPGAYKADLWRYCILYKLGGIYLDIKYVPINGFRFINLLEKEHFVLDWGNYGVYNALMVCKPGNEILLTAINKIIENVRDKFYGSSCLDPTGPNLLGKLFSDNEKNSFDLKHSLNGNGSVDSDKYILFNNHPVLKCYDGYFNERKKYASIQHYAELWQNRKIYK